MKNPLTLATTFLRTQAKPERKPKSGIRQMVKANKSSSFNQRLPLTVVKQEVISSHGNLD